MIEGKILQRIPVADKPLRLGGKIEYLTPEDFQRKFGFTYAEKVNYSESFKAKKQVVPESITGSLSSDALKIQLRYILENPRQDIAICKINDRVGDGLFAIDAIPKDSVLCFYSGTVSEGSQDTGHHSLGYCGDTNAMVSTRFHRGLASFFQHLPTKLRVPDIKVFQLLLKMAGQNVSEEALRLNDELYSIDFRNTIVSQNLETENIRREYINFEGISIILMVSNRDIPAGAQLGFNYGYTYWLDRDTVPELFDIKSNVLPAIDYRRTFWQLKFSGFDYIGPFNGLIEQLKSKSAKILLTDTRQEQRMVEPHIIADALLKVRAITQVEHAEIYHQYTITQSLKMVGEMLVDETSTIYTPKPVTSSFSENLKLAPLVTKYNLPGTSQASLEKGLRTAAANGNEDDLSIFIKHVKDINARDLNPQSQKTALYWAELRGHQKCCELLLAAGAIPVDAANKAASSSVPKLKSI